MENVRLLMQFVKKKFFFNKCCFFGRYGRKFRQLLFPMSKMDPENITFLTLNRPFLGKNSPIFPRTLFDPFYHQKNFGVGGPFFTFLDAFRTKKYWIFSKKKFLKEFIAKNDLEFSKKLFFIFMRKIQKSFLGKNLNQNVFIGVKTSYFAIFDDPVGFFGRFVDT